MGATEQSCYLRVGIAGARQQGANPIALLWE